jgi:hypothetical protein
MNIDIKFDSWKSAARHVGLLYMLWERLFICFLFAFIIIADTVVLLPEVRKHIQ